MSEITCGTCPAIFYNKMIGCDICSVMKGVPNQIHISSKHLPNCPIFNKETRNHFVYGDGLCKDFDEVFPNL